MQAFWWSGFAMHAAGAWDIDLARWVLVVRVPLVFLKGWAHQSLLRWFGRRVTEAVEQRRLKHDYRGHLQKAANLTAVARVQVTGAFADRSGERLLAAAAVLDRLQAEVLLPATEGGVQ